MASDNTCPICRAGYQSRCVHLKYVEGYRAMDERRAVKALLRP